MDTLQLEPEHVFQDQFTEPDSHVEVLYRTPRRWFDLRQGPEHTVAVPIVTPFMLPPGTMRYRLPARASHAQARRLALEKAAEWSEKIGSDTES